MHAGGTLGLFTGCSILSMFEVLYWIAKIAVKLASTGKRRTLAA